MPRLSDPRHGEPLQINSQTLNYSRWPVYQKGRRLLPQMELLTKNPWEAIENSINGALDRRSKPLDVCLSFLYQALDFYRAYEASRVLSKPLLLYYSILNLAKTYITYRNSVIDLANATHGLSENRQSYTKATITAKADNGRNREIYDLFSQALGEPQLAGDCQFSLSDALLSQIVIGHRLWSQAANKKERFVRAESIVYRVDIANQLVWITVDVRRSDLDGLGITAPQLIANSGLTDFRQVKAIRDGHELPGFARLEQVHPVPYATTPAEVVADLSRSFHKHVWCIMRTVPPYRRFYLWANKNRPSLINPMLSVYIVIFYLGSVTRYRPYYFEELQASAYGNLFDEIIQTQGQQILFHLAAEFQQRDVSWPAIL